MRPLYFWGSALLAALALAAAAALVVPLATPNVDALEHRRIWLLSLWTSGVMAICFGSTGLLSAVSPMSFRDVAEAGSVAAAIEARRETRRRLQASAFFNFAGWTVSTGAFLVLAYFVAWAAGGR